MQTSTTYFEGKVQANYVLRKTLLCLLMAMLIVPAYMLGQAPSSILPDLSYFKITFPVDANGNDNRNVSWSNRSSNYVKAAEVDNLVGYVPSSVYSPYFFVSNNEVVFKAQVAGALTSPNAYPRCELRETPNGTDDLWQFSDEHVLNATFRVTHLPDQKQEVCMLQIKGNSSNSTSNTEEAFRLEYRQDGSQGVHVTINENTTLTDIMDYAVGQTIVASMYVNNGQVTISLNNTNVSSSRGSWTYTYNSNYSWGYFKAGCYTQSSHWVQKNGVGTEDPDAYGEVRFSALSMTGGGNTVCNPDIPSNRVASNIGTTSATLSWNAVANIDHYNVRFRPSGTSSWTKYKVSSGTSYTLTGLSSNTTYDWQVRSKCADGSGSSYSGGTGPDFTTLSGTLSCSNGSNLADDGSIVSYSEQQSGNPASNIIDNNNSNRWSADGFPQNAVIDLGGLYLVDEIELRPYQNRAYQFLVEGSASSATSGFSTLTDARNNTSGGSVISRSFSASAVRYVRLTITGASGYSGIWSSIMEFDVICAGNTSRKRNTDESSAELRIFPNPFQHEFTAMLPAGVEEPSDMRIFDASGRLVLERKHISAGDKLRLGAELARGLYFLQWVGESGAVLNTTKLMKD
ncbi:MAG: polysaccharide lyase family 7 protein [Bacteroidota bacterium]